MRDYGKVSPQFWIGKTGKALRGNAEAQLLALYLMTSPHANMIGVFHCPVAYMAHETGMPLEGASKALQSLIEGGFCTYDEDSDFVWVHEMAKFQIGDELSEKDNQVKGIQKHYDLLPQGVVKKGFFDKYKDAFHVVDASMKHKPLRSPSKAPSKPGTGTGTGTGDISGFDKFWECWPSNDRKQDKAKCKAKWEAEGLDEVVEAIKSDVERKKLSKKWIEGYVEGPLVYLNNRRWEDGNTADGVPELKYGSDEYFEFHRKQSWWADAGFGSVWEAVSSRCNHKNFREFSNGQKIKEAA